MLLVIEKDVFLTTYEFEISWLNFILTKTWYFNAHLGYILRWRNNVIYYFAFKLPVNSSFLYDNFEEFSLAFSRYPTTSEYPNLCLSQLHRGSSMNIRNVLRICSTRYELLIGWRPVAAKRPFWMRWIWPDPETPPVWSFAAQKPAY